MAFVLFREAKLDMVVLETGLGGRLDATNVAAPELCVITQIDLDHQNFLGDTIEQIAAEKAGILKPGVPAIFSTQRPEATAVLRAHAQGPVVFASDCRIEDLEIGARGSRFRLAGTVIAGAVIECPLAGEHQVENARTAALALQQLGAGPQGMAGIANAHWPGRLEQVEERPEIILDGAHNPAGARALANYIQQFYRSRRIWLVYGAMRDKAVGEITPVLFPLANRIILTAANTPRALPPEQIDAPGATITHCIREAVALARQAGPEETVFITGSLFVVGEARELLTK